MPSISYTIFDDFALTRVRQIAVLSGDQADLAHRIFGNLKGGKPRERDIIAGCRIEHVDLDEESDLAFPSQDRA